MKYKILNNSTRGVIIDNSPIFGDIRSSFEIGFELPDSKSYVILLKGADGIEHRRTIIDGVCKLPREILKKEQYVEVKVFKVENETITQGWDCDPLKLTSFCNLRKSQWELAGGLTEDYCKSILDNHEENLATHNDTLRILTETKDTHEQKILQLNQLLDIKTTHITELENKLNEAIEAINNLSERVEFMENNYNPLEV